MSQTLRPPTPLHRPTPHTGRRYRLHRAGIVNVWQYDVQEFAFGDGRLLLRGKNGAGKSKALEMLLPYLLDGDSRALDATGTGRTTLPWLMLDGFEHTNRLGYLWVEFRRTTDDGGEHHLTLGAAVSASKSTKRAVPVFFITPLRIGEDLHLADGGHPLSLDGLRQRVGADNVTERAVDHRTRVARELFGINDPVRYRNLTQLLHRLRRPTVGDRIESGGLISLLSETLPGLDDDVVENVARNLQDLDTVRDELGRLERTDVALRAFLTGYRGYLAGVLRRAAGDVGQELDVLNRRRKDAGDAVKATSGLRHDEGVADKDLEGVQKKQQGAQAELTALRTSGGYRSLRELSERRETVAVLAGAAATIFASLERAHQAEQDAAGRLAAGLRRTAGRIGGLAAEHRELLTEAEKAGVPAGHFGDPVQPGRTVLSGPASLDLASPGGEVRTIRHEEVTVPDADGTTAALAEWHQRLEASRQVVKHRVRALQDVEALTGKAREARTAADYADAEQDRLEDEAVQAAEGLEECRGRVVDATTAYAAEVTGWAERTRLAVGPDCPPLRELGLRVSDFADGAPADVGDDVLAVARRLLDPYADDLNQRRDTMAVRVGVLADEHTRLEAEFDEWQRRTDPEPPVPLHRTAERSAERIAEQAAGTGTAFFRLVDFADGVPAADRAGLEAALEASGILDAWVSSDGAVRHPRTGDTLLVPTSASPDVPTLAEALCPVVLPGSGVTVGQIDCLLRSIALNSTRGGTAAAAVNFDGTWRLGPLNGRHHKDTAEFVGAAVRVETRRRRLTELHNALEETGGKLDAARTELTGIDKVRQELAGRIREFPRSRALAQVWLKVEAAESSVHKLAGDVAAARQKATELRATATTARREAEATASAHGLPTAPEALTRVGTALATLQGAVRGLCGGILSTAEDLRGSRSETDTYQRSHNNRRTAEGDYRLSLDELVPARQTLRTLEEAVGTAEAQILTREKQIEDEITATKRALPHAQEKRDTLREKRIRAEEKENGARRQLETQETVVVAAGSALRRALTRPEVLRGAGLDRSALPEQPGDDAPADTRSRIRALRELADAVRELLGPARQDVSDTALLNRHTELRDHLAGGFDAQLEEQDGVKICRLLDDHGSHDIAIVAERIAGQAAEAREKVTDREREIFQRFLTGELGDHLSAQVIAAANLVAALNDTLRTVRTSHGLGVELEWKLNADADADVRAAVGLLTSSSGLRTREENERLRTVLQRRIEEVRAADPSGGYAAHLRTALDYRDWFRFDTYVVDDAAPGRKRKLTGRTGLSQGEQRVLSYLVLFAAAAAHFTTLGEATPHAPRLILLDDAFAKVDEPTHGRLGRILVDLDLDFVLTSERLLGNWPEVPSLDIYECLRDPHVRGVATLHYTWNGRQRRLMSV